MIRLDQWLARPRKSFWDAVPQLRLLQALIAIPYIFTAVLLANLFGITDASTGDVVLLAVFATMAALETAFFLLWFRRPLATGQRPRRDLLWLCLGVAVGLTLLGTTAWVVR
jgi:hypothetical protein